MPLSPEQYELRLTGVTASEIAAVVGCCPYQRPIDVWQRKMGVEGDPPTYHMERGTYLEPAIIEWAAARHNWRVAPSSTVVHPAHPLVIATPDGLVADKRSGAGPHAVLEVKCPGHYAEKMWGEVGTDQVPDNYLCQVTWQMAATGLNRAYVVALMSGDVQLYEVEFNPRLFASLLSSAQRFWQRHVLTRQAPNPDGSPSYDGYLEKMFPPRPEEQEPVEDLSDEAGALVTEYREAGALLSSTKLAHAAAKQRLQHHIGERPGIVGGYGKVYYRCNKSSERTDWRAVAKLARPSQSVIDEHTTIRPGARVLRVHEDA